MMMLRLDSREPKREYDARLEGHLVRLAKITKLIAWGKSQSSGKEAFNLMKSQTR